MGRVKTDLRYFFFPQIFVAGAVSLALIEKEIYTFGTSIKDAFSNFKKSSSSILASASQADNPISELSRRVLEFSFSAPMGHI